MACPVNFQWLLCQVAPNAMMDRSFTSPPEGDETPGDSWIVRIPQDMKGRISSPRTHQPTGVDRSTLLISDFGFWGFSLGGCEIHHQKDGVETLEMGSTTGKIRIPSGKSRLWSAPGRWNHPKKKDAPKVIIPVFEARWTQNISTNSTLIHWWRFLHLHIPIPNNIN